MWPFGKSTEKRVEEALKENAALKNYDLEVSVKKKTAVVTGEVPRDSLKNLIKAVAEGINGVKDVDTSGITVAAAEAPSAPAQSSSAPAQASSSVNISVKDEPAEDPSAKAKAAYQKIRDEASLQNNPLDVLQKGSTVVLRGAVDSEQEFDKAKSLAMSVEGVTGVDTTGLQVIQNASQLNDTDDDGDVVYTVKSGDTLSHIALHYYGDAGRSSYMKIAEANGIDNPNLIQVGQQLKIPGTTAGPDASLA